MPNNKIWKKSLVIGIIALFVGIAVIPSVNSIDIVRSKNIQEIINNPVIEISDSEDDCKCEVVSKSDIYRLERLLNRLEFIVKIILIRFRDNPEVKEKCQVILDVINSGTPQQIPEKFCTFLEHLVQELVNLLKYINEFTEGLTQRFPNFELEIILLFYPISTFLVFNIDSLNWIGVLLCDWVS